MKGKGLAPLLGAALATAVLGAGCGQGHIIFNVDAYSFMQGTGADTLRYPPLPIDSIPPGAPAITVGSDTIKVVLPGGIGNSFVDTVRVFGIIDLDNARGTGSLSVQVFLSADSTTIYSGTPAFNFGGNVTPGNVTKDTVDVELVSTFNSLFTGKAVWLAFRANVTNSGATPMQGVIRLRRLDLRVVVQDKVF